MPGLCVPLATLLVPVETSSCQPWDAQGCGSCAPRCRASSLGCSSPAASVPRPLLAARDVPSRQKPKSHQSRPFSAAGRAEKLSRCPHWALQAHLPAGRCALPGLGGLNPSELHQAFCNRLLVLAAFPPPRAGSDPTCTEPPRSQQVTARAERCPRQRLLFVPTQHPADELLLPGPERAPLIALAALPAAQLRQSPAQRHCRKAREPWAQSPRLRPALSPVHLPAEPAGSPAALQPRHLLAEPSRAERLLRRMRCPRGRQRFERGKVRAGATAPRKERQPPHRHPLPYLYFMPVCFAVDSLSEM